MYIQNKLLAQGISESLLILHLTILYSQPSLIYTLKSWNNVSLTRQEKSLKSTGSATVSGPVHFTFHLPVLVWLEQNIQYGGQYDNQRMKENKECLDFELVHAFNSMFCSPSTLLPLGNQICFFFQSCLIERCPSQRDGGKEWFHCNCKITSCNYNGLDKF